MNAIALPRRINLPLVLGTLACLALAAGLAWAWRNTELAQWVTLQRTVGWIEQFQAYWWAPLLVVLSFIPAMLVMFPRPLITVAAVVVFGPWKGFLYCILGAVISSQLAYYAGRLVDERRIERMAGRKYGHLKRLLDRKGLMAVTAMRLLPGPPFVVESIAAGALRVKAWHMAAGTFLGMAPGMFFTTVLGHQVSAIFSEGREVNRWIVAAVVAAFVAMTWATHRWYKRQG